MSNRLKMVQVEMIAALIKQGWSRRRIARELGIHRDTVARYVKQCQSQGPPSDECDSKPAILHTGVEDETEAKPAIPHTGSVAGRRSQCEPLRKEILQKLEAGLSAQRIHQDLSTEHGFEGSYSAVQRFVNRFGKQRQFPFRRMECEAGAEAQIDFGSGAPIVGPNGTRRSHVFRIVLSHSRKGYSEAVSRQTTDNFIACLENAFWSWGGVPRTLVIDNLKAAVTQADWYDPELNPKLVAFCRHYGTVLLPTKPYMPRHKGKIESGIKYVRRNALKGRAFEALSAQNTHLEHWESHVADLRIHGTTKKQVREVFASERNELQPLPQERFPFFYESQRVVHRDGHVEVDKAYYSVPPEYMSRTVWVRWDSRLVRIFSGEFKQLAVHARQESGRFSTDAKHLAMEKISGVERGATELLRRARLIGPQTARWAESMLKTRGIEGVRVLVGLLALVRGHSSAALEKACERAAGHGAFRLRELRALLKAPVKQEQMEFMAEHPVIRNMYDYGEIVSVSFREGNPWKEPQVQAPASARNGVES